MKEENHKIRIFVVLAGIVLTGCAHSSIAPKQFVELTYADFGPPALAEPLVGNDYWQWQNHGDSRLRHYPISVIVYRSLTAAEVQRRFPVIREKKQDYRYVTYESAIAFLDEAIKGCEMHPEEMPKSLVEKLRQTRNGIETALGDK